VKDLKPLTHLASSGDLGREVEVVFQDHMTEQPKPVVGPLMRPAVQKDLNRIRSGEDG
jgi:hypothetical protein